ncbi:hypothetical protein GGR56DRAFT_289930 [Xylariaceae sp. FL0804]|nr:hypothetical protein GGR56DRAFT_289930 [Xylariaceae sp. FL0804]
MPEEVMRLMASYLDQEALKNLCEVSKDMNTTATRGLYESFEVRKIDLKNFARFGRMLRQIPPEHMRHTRHVRLEHGKLDILPKPNMVMDVSGQPGFGRFCLNLCSLLLSIPDDQLRSFSWDLAVCLPPSLREMLHKQTMIEDIHFITDIAGNTERDVPFGFHNLGFPALRSLTWMSNVSPAGLVMIRYWIDKHRESLHTLSIGLDYNPFVGLLDRSLLSPGQMVLTPSLRRLSLAELKLTGFEKTILLALNFPNLRSLRLWNCQSSYAFLKSFVPPGRTLRLKDLELVIDWTWFWASELDSYYSIYSIGHCVSRFLRAFQGLDTLSLMLPCFVNWGSGPGSVFNGVLNHHKTLKHFVAHSRGSPESRHGEGPMHDKPIPWCLELGRICSNKNLVRLGLNMLPSVLKDGLRSLADKPVFEVLHVRLTFLYN